MSDNPQVTVWNDDVGSAWVTYADHYDATLQPFGDAALQRLNVHAGDRVVDIGCGAGATTLQLAALAAPATIVGVDISKPMLSLAVQRATAAGLTNVTFTEHDVEAESLGAGQFDAAFSRMGVMFFQDPVRAFTHIHQSLVPGGRLAFACFQKPADNPFIVVPAMAAAQVLKMGPPSPDGPSPFAFADPERVTAILTAAGFQSVSIESGPTSGVLGSAADLPAMARRLLEQNPTTGALFAVASPATREEAVAASAAALARHVVDGVVKLAAATWIVSATSAQ